VISSVCVGSGAPAGPGGASHHGPRPRAHQRQRRDDGGHACDRKRLVKKLRSARDRMSEARGERIEGRPALVPLHQRFPEAVAMAKRLYRANPKAESGAFVRSEPNLRRCRPHHDEQVSEASATASVQPGDDKGHGRGANAFKARRRRRQEASPWPIGVGVWGSEGEQLGKGSSACERIAGCRSLLGAR
jgi:hypothetical protein